MKQVMPTIASLLLFCTYFTSVFAQPPAPAAAPLGPTTSVSSQPPALVAAPPAPPTLVPARSSASAPSPSGPTDVTAILKKAGRFTKFIHLLKTTQSVERLHSWLNNTGQGLTIFAPNDAAFAKLKSGTLNSYTDEQQTQLVQSHVLPSSLSISQFQTASNPLSTQAGGTNYGEFPLNVTTAATSVNLTTGFANASIVDTVYTDNQLAIYEVDHVLFPQRFFVAPPPSPPPAPAPAPSKHKKRPAQASSSISAVSSDSLSLIQGKSVQASYVFASMAAAWLF